MTKKEKEEEKKVDEELLAKLYDELEQKAKIIEEYLAHSKKLDEELEAFNKLHIQLEEETKLLFGDLAESKRLEKELEEYRKRMEESREKLKENVNERLFATLISERNTLKKTLEERNKKLAEKTKMLDECLSHFRKLQLEHENCGKRIEEEKKKTSEDAAEKILLELLPAGDSFISLVDTMKKYGERREVIREVESAFQKFLQCLEKQGIRPICKSGETLDLTKHEVVKYVPSDIPENKIVDVLQQGYMYKDRVIRRAMVTVAKGAEIRVELITPPEPIRAEAPPRGEGLFDKIKKIAGIGAIETPKEDKYRKEDIKVIREPIITQLKRHLTNLSGIIVDIKCGKGYFVRFLAEEFGTASFGIDEDESAISIAKLEGVENVFVGSAKTLPMFGDGTVDAVVSWLLFVSPMKTDEAREILSECARIIRNEGVIIHVGKASLLRDACAQEYLGRIGLRLVEEASVGIFDTNIFVLKKA